MGLKKYACYKILKVELNKIPAYNVFIVDGEEKPKGGVTIKSIRTMLLKEKKHWQLYLLILIPLAHVIVFSYIPMYGVQIAFKNFYATKGIMGSPWAGFKYFEQFFNSFRFLRLIRNTLLISASDLIIRFPIAVLFALVLNEIKALTYKKLVQTVTYVPYFISTVVMVGMLLQFLDKGGLINKIAVTLGFESESYMSQTNLFIIIYVLSNIWQYTGYSAIIYIAALSAVDTELYDACRIDGASKLQKVLNVDIPAILPTIVIMLILSVGKIMNVGFEKIYLMQNPLNLEASEVISTYVYELGLTQAKYSFASAVGLFNSVINFILLISVNKIAKSINGYNIW